jgi:hypothetical protein
MVSPADGASRRAALPAPVQSVMALTGSVRNLVSERRRSCEVAGQARAARSVVRATSQKPTS